MEVDDISAGRLRHQVTILGPPLTPLGAVQRDSLGQPKTSRGDPTPLTPIAGPIWASIETNSQAEGYGAQQVQATGNIRIVIRYSACPNVSVSYQVHYADPGTGQTRIFDVSGAYDPTQRRRALFIICNERGS